MSETLDRRGFLKIGAAAGGAVVLAACAPELKPSPERERQSRIEFGFNTRFYTSPNEQLLHLDRFKTTCDQLAALQIPWIRFPLWDWDIKPESLPKYDEAIDYAKSKGLKVFLVTNVDKLSADPRKIDQLTRKTRRQYELLGRRWGDKVDYWQIFNEGDDHLDDNYNRNPGFPFPPGYLERRRFFFKTAVDTLRQAVGEEHGVEAKVTTNVSKWVGADAGVNPEEVVYFDAVCGFDNPGGAITKPCSDLDSITLDLYPDLDPNEILDLPRQVSYFSTRYGVGEQDGKKDVIVAELGLPERSTRAHAKDWDPIHQAASIIASIRSLNSGPVKPRLVFPHEYIDTKAREENSHEGSFGIMYADGTPKESFEPVIREMWRIQNQP